MHNIRLNKGVEMPTDGEINSLAEKTLSFLNIQTGRYNDRQLAIANEKLNWIRKNTDCAGIVHVKSRRYSMIESFIKNVNEVWDQIKNQ